MYFIKKRKENQIFSKGLIPIKYKDYFNTSLMASHNNNLVSVSSTPKILYNLYPSDTLQAIS